MMMLFILFIFSPAVQAEEQSGQAVFKDLIIEEEGIQSQVEEPLILFEGQSYIPLRVVADRLKKNIYLDQSTNNLVMETSNVEDLAQSQPVTIPSQFRPKLTFDADVSSAGIIVMEDNEQNIMFENNGFSRFYPASTTKILTALIALERGNLDDKVIVSENVNKLPSDSRRVYIQPGDELTLEQLLYGLLLYSGNDSALAIAEYIAGTEAAFAELMNEKARELGAKNSNFVNSHGYHDPEHYTTPYDLALILKAASQNPQFLKIINTSSYKAEYKNKEGNRIVRTWGTTNRFLKDPSMYVAGIIGGKTGFTDIAQFNLVTIADYNGHRYFVVALKGDSTGRYYDTKKLLMNAYKTREEFDKKYVKDIKVSFLNNAIELDHSIIPTNDQLFIYKGRTYLSQSLISKALATIKQNSVNEDLVKLTVEPKFAIVNKIQPLSYAFATQKIKQDLLVQTGVKMLGVSFMNPVSFMMDVSIYQVDFYANLVK